jgi:hypothetical protein
MLQALPFMRLGAALNPAVFDKLMFELACQLKGPVLSSVLDYNMKAQFMVA